MYDSFVTGTKLAAGHEHAAGAQKDALPTTVVVGPVRAAAVGSPATSPMPTPGGRVGRYRLLEQLGRGGMGVVFVAHDPELDRRVAIKFLRSGENEARFVREARALAKLSHPNVVPVYDVGRCDDRTFIAMELIDGVTLADWAFDVRSNLRQKLDVLIHAGRGLAAAHAAGLVHRDFKPDNVVLGSDGRVRVIDFGIVSASGADQERPEVAEAMGAGAPNSGEGLTVAGSLMGTPAYMAPEQLRAEPIDERADQFSFSVAAWETLYGRRPYPGLRFARDPSAPPEPLDPPPNAQVPLWLRRIFERGLSLEREERFSSMDAMLAAIEEGLARQEQAAKLIGGRYDPVPSTDPANGSTPAVDRLTGKLVSVRRVVLDREGDSDSTRARVHLARAFRSLSSLRHPNLVGVLDLGFDSEGMPYLVLDQSDWGQPLALVASDDAGTILDYLVQLLRVLGYLHSHRVMLGGVMSHAIVVVEHQVKLLPLGVDLDRSSVPSDSLAPEVARGGRASIQGDLFSFGLLAYELLAGERVPADVRRGEASLDSKKVELLPAAAPVLERLLNPLPEARYASAEQVIAALASALERQLFVDTAETRESRLRAAPLTGREREVVLLHQAVRRAVVGEGGAWLIEGESGVGKSRLLDEVGTLGLVHGAVVLRGQEQSENSSPYRLFRDALRWLALTSELDQLEAGVLLPLIPNLPTLLGRPIAVAPELDARSMQQRLLEVVERLLRRQERPLLLLLEDLHWSHSDSLTMLADLLPLTTAMPLLIVATYADERPDVAKQLTQMNAMHLPRLNRDAIGQLAVAIIGEAGERDEVVDLLHRQTEGNAFFLVEVMRALVEEAGGVERVGLSELPKNVFAGGIRRFVQRRLRRVPTAAQSLLQLAAVNGRQIDPDLLRVIEPSADLEHWQSLCIEAGVLDRTRDEVHFAHDQLRRGVLEPLDAEERARLHLVIAEALEKLHADDPQYHVALAHHFGRGKLGAKHAHYAALAGKQTMLHGSGPEGITLLQQALEGMSKYGSPLDVANVGTHLSLKYCHMSDAANAFVAGRAALNAVGVSCPSSTLARALALVWHLLIHLLYRLVPWIAKARSAVRRAECGAASNAASALVETSIHSGDNTGVLLFSLMAYNLSMRAGEPDQTASGFIGFALSCLGRHRLAASYFATEPSETEWRGRTYAILKASHLIGIGELRLAEEVLRRDAAVAVASGFRSALAYLHFLQGYCAFFRGHLPQAEVLFRKAVAVESTRGPFLHALALTQCWRGRVLEALPTAEQATDESLATSPRAVGLGVLAMLKVRTGDVRGALERADQARALSVEGYTFGYAGLGYFTGLLEAYLAELERVVTRHGRGSAPTHAAALRVKELLRQGQVWARGVRVGLAQIYFYDGKLADILGDQAAAGEAWRRSLAVAEEMELGLHEAFACLELGRTTNDPAERAQLFERARPLLEQANALGALEQRGVITATESG